jgi:mRNA-degrading endonuclease RelE of RelBE toxin-antitoxin system
LVSDPRREGSRKLVGWPRRYRQHVGAFRLIYDIYEPERIVVIARVIRRSETTYRRLR